MTDAADIAPSSRLTRRRLLAAGAGAGAAGLGGALILGRGGEGGGVQVASRPLPPSSPGLPVAQHAWDDRLARDAHGNVVAPRHQLLLHLDLVGEPSREGATWIEAALRRIDSLEPTVHTTLGWGPGWFARVGLESPVPPARALSETEAPELDRGIACLHLACDDPDVLVAVDAALSRGAALPGGRPGEADLRPVLRVVGRASGFVGDGLPAARVDELSSRDGVRVPARSPLFMGFPSGMRRNQATEAAVTIDTGRWRGGSTMHVSRIALTLPSWYASLDAEQRAMRMHGPGVTAAAASDPGDGLDPPTSDLAGTARRYGVVGHTQAAAVARRRDRPVILRRDFNGVDDGQPMVHFVALARQISDFEATREAMNAAAATDASPSVGAQINNGINEWLSVHARANYLVPVRAARAFPGLPGSAEAA